MAVAAIHVVPDDNFDDWVVRDDDGHEIGHYPTREDAELAVRPIARELETRLVVHLLTGDGAPPISRKDGSPNCSVC